MIQELTRAREIHTTPMPEGKNCVATDEGFLQVTDAIVWSVGVMPYPQQDGTVRYEFTPPEELADPETVASFRTIPVTDGHPPLRRGRDGKPRPIHEDPFNGLVSATDNYVGIGATVGGTGKEPRFDGRNLRLDFGIHKNQGVQSARRGRKQLSPGYRYRLEPVTEADAEKYGFAVTGDGYTFEGKPVTHIKRRMRGNHLALVDRARNGAHATIQFDGYVMEVAVDGAYDDTPIQEQPMTTKTVTIAGVDYVVPPEVANKIATDGATIETLKTEKSTLEGKVETLTQTVAARDGEIAALPAKITAAAASRAVVLEKAKKVLGDTAFAAIAADAAEDVFMKAALAKHNPGLKFEGKDAAFISGAFETIAVDGETPLQKQMRQLNGGDGAIKNGNDAAPTRKVANGKAAMEARNRAASK